MQLQYTFKRTQFNEYLKGLTNGQATGAKTLQLIAKPLAKPRKIEATAHNREIVKSPPTKARPSAGFLLRSGYQNPTPRRTIGGTAGFTQRQTLCRGCSVYEPLKDPAAITAANQFFDDLVALADPDNQLPLLRPQVEDYRWETLNHSGHPMTRDQLHGFLSGLMVAGTLSPEQIHTLSQRLNKGQAAGWM